MSNSAECKESTTMMVQSLKEVIKVMQSSTKMLEVMMIVEVVEKKLKEKDEEIQCL